MTTPAEVLLKVYGIASLRGIAARYDCDTDDCAVCLEEKWADKKARRKIVEGLNADDRAFLAFMDRIGRRLRGERLKKRWFLHGYADFDQRVMPLVDAGVVVVGNVSAREPVALETALEQGILQQWLQVTPGFEGFAGEPPEKRQVVDDVDDETRTELERRLLVVEFNLLNVVRFVETDAVRLNRDASPHRSDLKAMAPVIVDRYGSDNEAEVTPDPLHIGGWDVHIFLLSVAESLGMLRREGDLVIAVPEGLVYFTRPLEERIPIIFRALEQQRAWSEIQASAWYAAGETPATGHGDGAFEGPDEKPSQLAGPRGSVLSALRRLEPKDWFDVDETTRTISSLESRYLGTALPVGLGGEPVIEDFVRAVITRTLTHVGAAELGKGRGGARRARLTEVGQCMLGIGDCPEEPSGKGAILVEPNFEVTCFLDMASAPLLYDLSRFTELIRTSERVVRYRLTGEAVQWGYARGYTADRIMKVLTDYSSQPIPPAVKFALEDWERIHRRVTVFLCGDLVAATGKSDPEIVQSAVTFAIEGEDNVERVDGTFTFVNQGFPEELDRALRAQKPEQIEYTGPYYPSLVWIDDERLRAPLGATDLRILSALERISVVEDENIYRIAPDKVRSEYGEDEGYEQVIRVLRDGVAGGLAAEKEIMLKSLLGRPADASIETMDVLMVTSGDDGDRVDQIKSLEKFIEQRLGPCAFQVKKGQVEKLAKALRGLGIAVET